MALSRYVFSSKKGRHCKYLKVVSTTVLLVCFLSLNKSTCQVKTHGFYFTSKALFVLEKIKF